jgi:hypothetical protein
VVERPRAPRAAPALHAWELGIAGIVEDKWRRRRRRRKKRCGR